MVDLLKVLSDNDKEILTSYIDHFGVIKEYFKGVDAWLVDWNKSKQKLYHLLGNQLIVKKEIRIQKDESVIRKEKITFFRDHEFLDDFYDAMVDGYYNLIEKRSNNMSEEHQKFIDFVFHITAVDNLVKGTCGQSFKFKWGDRKLLQIQEGTKMIRVIGKMMEYFKEFCSENLFKEFEDFCNKLSLITNDKFFKGNLCLSIHPMDFITMSDNAENWTSCMNWTREGGTGGCYHVGTVEMMNSNCVVVAYFESDSKKFKWGEEEEEKYEWNSKKWRVLCYVTKDIIVSGKSYPYYNEDLTFVTLNFLHELAEKNMNWKYQYGIEPYKDMIHISNTKRMENNKSWIKYNHTKKHNIIFDSRGMYNDMVNCSNYSFWCYRNKVDHNIVINYSGKSTCLCCNNQVSEFVCDDDDYNSRYEETGYVVCYECRDKFSCARCHTLFSRRALYSSNLFEFEGQYYCEDCAKEAFAMCPDCGVLFKLEEPSENEDSDHLNIFTYDENVYKMTFEDFMQKKIGSKATDILEWFVYNDGGLPNYYEDNECPTYRSLNMYFKYGFKPLYMCEDCKKKFLEIHPYKKYDVTLPYLTNMSWGFQKSLKKFRLLDQPITMENPKMFSRYRYQNLNH